MSIPEHCQSSLEAESTIYLFRHGARYDLDDPSWRESIVKVGGLVTDTPLSAEGHEQSRKAAIRLGKLKVDEILVSPYLRTIQTAIPFSLQMGVKIFVEDGLAEAPHVPGVLPSPLERFKYFSQIDTNYKPILIPVASPNHFHIELNKPQETFPLGYFQRIIKFAELIENKCFGKTLLCFSHAASVALVAALLRCNIEDIPADVNSETNARTDLFAPLGMYKLTRRGKGKWILVRNGSTNNNLSCKDSKTYAWGYDEFCLQTWKEFEFEINLYNK
jgi:broad specificity phosphatase PhoE